MPKEIPFDRSFASHPKAQCWSPKNEVGPEEIYKGSTKKFWFICNECHHEFETFLSSMVRGRNGCAYCCSKKLCSDDGCDKCFNTSFASHEKSLFLSPKNEISSRKMFKNSNIKRLFICNVCDHEFSMALYSITYGNSWCPFCANSKMCDDEKCNFCFDKSFQSHAKSSLWSPNNEISPRKVSKHNGRKFLFICDKCNNEFSAVVSSMPDSSLQYCPYCINKTELKLFGKLSEIYPVLKCQSKFDWCKNKTFLPFDFVLNDKKIIIELDGRQHFERVGKWQSYEETQKIDKFKMKCANNNGYSVIRILQKDVLRDKYDWLTELKQNITLLAKKKKPQNIFMCKKNEYDSYLE